jgi:hypothetical protein
LKKPLDRSSGIFVVTHAGNAVASMLGLVAIRAHQAVSAGYWATLARPSDVMRK